MRFLLLLALLPVAVAQPAAKTKTRKPHTHGTAKLDVALEADGKSGTVQLEAPAQSIVGFEYQAKSAFDKKKVDIGLATVRNRMHEMVMFAPGKQCRLTPKNVELHRDGTHSEVHGEFALSCAQPLGGSEVRFGFTKVFPGLEAVAVQLISDKQQSAETVKKDKGAIPIQP